MRHLCTVFVLTLALPVLGADEDAAVVREGRARAFLTALGKEDYVAARKDFDEAMDKALPEDKLRDIWLATKKQYGALKTPGAIRTERKAPYDIVIVACEFGKSPIDMRIVFDGKNRITGWQIKAPTKDVPYAPPAYVHPETFVERPLTVGVADWPLPGTLTLPRGDGPFAAVVLVHGSGPHDRDETIGPNKPFRDLAWGLASKGIAVLRYEKRTKEHSLRAAREKGLTVKEETVDDAVAAVAALRAVKEIDPQRVFVLGHSLGAFVGPQIGARDAKLAGLILVAGNSRPLEDIILEQLTYVIGLKGEPTEETRAYLKQVAAQVARVKDPGLAVETPAEDLPLKIPAAYWLGIRGYDPPAAAAKLAIPLFILQGERDYQVTMTDFDGWKKALADRQHVSFRSYRTLNHLFMEGKGKATPAEYEQVGHVASEVLDDLAAWILKR
jgi:uncharacterized protein